MPNPLERGNQCRRKSKNNCVPQYLKTFLGRTPQPLHLNTPHNLLIALPHTSKNHTIKPHLSFSLSLSLFSCVSVFVQFVEKMRMSCNGCRVLRKGCSENCSIRPCLQWIKSPESQANATVFLAKFYGRAGLMNLINAGPEHLRPG
jgi:hypothetical protein